MCFFDVLDTLESNDLDEGSKVAFAPVDVPSIDNGNIPVDSTIAVLCDSVADVSPFDNIAPVDAIDSVDVVAPFDGTVSIAGNFAPFDTVRPMDFDSVESIAVNAPIEDKNGEDYGTCQRVEFLSWNFNISLIKGSIFGNLNPSSETIYEQQPALWRKKPAYRENIKGEILFSMNGLERKRCPVCNSNKMFRITDLYNHANSSHSQYKFHSLNAAKKEFKIGNRCAWAVYLPELLNPQPRWNDLLNHLQTLWIGVPVFQRRLFHVWNVVYHYLDFREKRILYMLNKLFYKHFRPKNVDLGKAICNLSNSALKLSKVRLLLNCNTVRWEHINSRIEYFFQFRSDTISRISQDLPLDVGVSYDSKYGLVSIKMVATEPRFRMASFELNNIGFNMRNPPSVQLYARSNGSDKGKAVGVLEDKYFLCWSKLEETWCLEMDWNCIACKFPPTNPMFLKHEGSCGVLCLYFNLEEGFFDLNNLVQLGLMSNFGMIVNNNHKQYLFSSFQVTSASSSDEFCLRDSSISSVFVSSDFISETEPKLTWFDLNSTNFINYGRNIGFLQTVSQPLRMPLNSKDFIIQAPEKGTYLQIVDDWRPEIVSLICNGLKNFSGYWKVAYFDLFAPKTDGYVEHPYILPKPHKVTLYFRKSGSPLRYFSHSGMYYYEALDESCLSIIKHTRELLQMDFNCELNWINVNFYFDEKSQILLHADHQCNSGWENQEEIIITLCVMGKKMMLFKRNSTDETVHVLHSENQLYIMKGIQKTFKHAKMKGSLKSRKLRGLFPELQHLTDFSHISVVFRNLKDWDHKESIRELSTHVKFSWSNLNELQMHWMTAPTYIGLHLDEPVGYCWPSRYHMWRFGAFRSLIGGFCNLNGKIVAVIDNVYGNTFGEKVCEYLGHASSTSKLSAYNRQMVITAQSLQPIRYYLGHKSSNCDAPSKGYKLMGLYYVLNFVVVPFVGEDIAQKYGNGFKKRKLITKKSYQWRFTLLNGSDFSCLSDEMKQSIVKNCCEKLKI